MRELAAVLSLVFGLVFSTLGVVGFLRLADPLSRLHALGKTLTFGTGGALVAAAISAGERGALKALSTMALLLLTAPVVTHELARRVVTARPRADDATDAGARGAPSRRDR